MNVSPRGIRTTARVVSVAVAAALLGSPVATVGMDLAGARPAARAVPPTMHTERMLRAPSSQLRATDGSTAMGFRASAARVGALSGTVSVTGRIAVVGVTWPSGQLGTDDRVQVRVLDNGVWGGWSDIPRESADHAPDPGTAEARSAQGRDGTEPYVAIGSSVQARVLSSDAALTGGLDLDVVDPGTSAADATVGAAAPGAAAAAAARPTIYSRAQWGADESIRRADPSYGQVQVAFVHHTDSSNTYSAAQVPAIIRGIYAFHVKGRGWNDIGYNFLVDRFGRLWEGRYGGTTKAVIGAHTLNYNSWSFGISAIGNFTSTTPPAAMTSSISRLIAWKLTIHGIQMPASATINGKSFWRVSGHRDANSTACPGQRLYNALPAIRRSVIARMGTLPRTVITRDVDGAYGPDLIAYPTPAPGEATPGPVTLLRTVSRIPTAAFTTLGGGWNTLRTATLSPDLTGDGTADLLAQDPAGKRLRVYRGTGAGGLNGYVTSGTAWGTMTALLPLGDVDGNGTGDLMAVGPKGWVYFYPGAGNGTFPRRYFVASGWTAYTSVTAGPDRNGDGIGDILAVRRSDGRLVWMPVRSNHTVGAAVALTGGWGPLSPVLSAGDLDRDGNADILAREPGGGMRTYYGDASQAPSRWNRWGGGWGVVAQLSSGVDFTGDGVVDLVGVVTTLSNGTMRVYPGTGQRDLVAGPTLTGLDGADLVQLVGDINGDGHTDIVARVGDSLVVLPGQAGSTFGPPVVVGATGWAAMTKIAAAGDISYDGVPDLLATTVGGRVLRYAFNRNLSLQAPLELEQGWQSFISVTGAGAFNADANGDVVALMGNGTIALFRGSGDTPLIDYTVLRTGQTDLTQIVGVGDFNGDGLPDIVGSDGAGHLWLYGGTGNGTLAAGRQPMTGAPAPGWSIG